MEQIIIEKSIINESLTSEIFNKYDTNHYLEEIFTSYFKNPFFPWLVIVLLLNRNKWKRPVIYMLIAFWFLQSTENIFSHLINILSYKQGTEWPHTKAIWYIESGVSKLFYFGAEIVGDWYLLLRTKAILGRKKTPLLDLICIIYNLTKGFIMVIPFYDAPSLNSHGEIINKEFIRNHYSFMILAIMVIQIASILYDLVIVYYLQKKLFIKCKDNTSLMKNNFFEKLKITSEYRIVASLLLSFIFVPIGFILYIEGPKDKERELFEALFKLRYALIYINYFIMYIDQILLRFYAERNNPKFKISSTNTYMFKRKRHLSGKSLASSSSNSSSINTFISRNKRQFSSKSLMSNSDFHAINMPEGADTLSDSNSLKTSNSEGRKSFDSYSLRKILLDNNSLRDYKHKLSTKSVVSFSMDNLKSTKSHSITKTESLTDSSSLNSSKPSSIGHSTTMKTVIDFNYTKNDSTTDSTSINKAEIEHPIEKNKSVEETTEVKEENKPIEKPIEETTKVKEENKPIEETTKVKEENKPIEETTKVKEENKPIEETTKVKEENKPIEETTKVKEENKSVEETTEVKEENKSVEETTEVKEESKPIKEATEIKENTTVEENKENINNSVDKNTNSDNTKEINNNTTK